jgi:hypothetical protein
VIITADRTGSVGKLAAVLGGELPTNRKWVSSPQGFQWINPLQKSHVHHWGELTHKNDSWVVRHQVHHHRVNSH